MSVHEIMDTLQRDGLYVFPNQIDAQTLSMIQSQFHARLSQMSIQRGQGYYMDDPYRLLVDDVLLLGPEMVETALRQDVVDVVRAVIGNGACLTEAKGWRSLPTRRNIHGWHSDAWYDPALEEVPPQLKLGVYLSDVTSGGLAYLKGSQGQRACHWTDERAEQWEDGITQVLGKAGTMFLFDPSGIHRQARPLLSTRDALFLVFHDPAVPLQEADERSHRYHPPLVSVDALGHLSESQLDVLGVGQQHLRRPQWRYTPRHRRTDQYVTSLYRTLAWVEHGYSTYVYGARRMRRTLGSLTRQVFRRG